MRVATFSKRYAECIGAQVNATVTIMFANEEVRGQLALRHLMCCGRDD